MQVVHVNKMKRYLIKPPPSWDDTRTDENLSAEIMPTIPELTFNDSFFADLPDTYNSDDDVADTQISLDPGDADIDSDPSPGSPIDAEEEPTQLTMSSRVHVGPTSCSSLRVGRQVSLSPDVGCKV